MRFYALTCCLFACWTLGCASGSYQYGQGWRSRTSNLAKSTDSTDHGAVVVEAGQPRPIIDGVGWVLGIPSKLILWDRRVDNHNVSPATQAAIVEYLDQNDLQDVCVRVNQYAPLEEWKRLRENRQVSAGWRYTAGLLSLAGYTVLPGRLFGGDRYNPYTNSVYVYSDIPALAMVGGGYAKDIHNREYPGTYAVVNELPVVSMWHETIATNDVLSYLQQQESLSELQAGYKILHPYYGSQVGGAAQNLIGVGPVFQVAGAVVGHVTGRAEGDRIAKLSEQSAAEAAQQARKGQPESKTLTASKPATESTAAEESPIVRTAAEAVDSE
ncbi:MAG: hypothetical protein JWN70_3503 [Planctomycetaceae bacterium]|nr:hypothetical protein [Planctomycetaceae bacterium]